MTTPTVSVYDYLTFVIPGGTVMAAAIYGSSGWKLGEPGISGFAVLAIAAFVAGHILSGFAAWIAPVWWLSLPGRSVSSSQGLFGKRGLYGAQDEKVIRDLFQRKYEFADFDRQWASAYTDALHGSLAPRLEIMVEKIGFYRSMAAASVVSVALILAMRLSGETYLPLWPWLVVGVVAWLAFVYRYRRFWVRLGDYVIRESMRA